MDAVRLELVTQAKRTLIDLAIRYGPRLVTAILILIAGIFLILRVARLVSGWLTRREMEPPLKMLLVRILSVVLFLICFMLALQNLGIELLPLLASLGVAGIGAGLALQGVLSNVVAGLTIIFTRPYRIGDYIAIAGVEGQVQEVTLFSTLLGHYDRSTVVVPNRKIVGEILHKYGKSRQIDLKVGVSYSTDLPRALALITEILGSSARVLKDPAPVVGVSMLADSSIEISIRPWVQVQDYVFAGNEIYQAVVRTFQAASIQIPFPQQEVRLLNAAPEPSPAVLRS